MALAAGSRLGPYEILALLGAGGMGEVYRARDTRLGREVAIKVLPSTFATDPLRLVRFEQEARAVAALNHPNIVAVYDLGTHEGSPYLVSELLDGQTLRDRLKDGPIPPRRAIEWAIQTARGLSAAHQKGIVHRDLKPENLFLVKGGQIKILDFGVAKITTPVPLGDELTSAPTMEVITKPHVVMGTVGYMSPEQARGDVVDPRSDIFSFGTVLYEMLSSQRAFHAPTAIEVLNAILKEDPADLPPGMPELERIVRHCLEKNAEDRFQTASDLAFNLEALASASTRTTDNMSVPKSSQDAPSRDRRGLNRLLVLGGALVVLLGAAYLAQSVGKRQADPPAYQRLTFRHGYVTNARFAPDGQTVCYGARWGADPVEVFSTRTDSKESRSLSSHENDLLAVSSTGDMAIKIGGRQVGPFLMLGTLARVPLAGGEPRELLEDVQFADWSPDGSKLAVVRSTAGKTRIELGSNVLYETGGWISDPRFSPRGDRIAFLDHPLQDDDAGSVAIVDLSGHKTELSGGWSSIAGLAWHPSGAEIWFTGAKSGWARGMFATTLAGKTRLVLRDASTLTLTDIAKDGRALMIHQEVQGGMIYLDTVAGKSRDISWLDSGIPTDITPDGKTLLFTEVGEGGGPVYGTYLRKIDAPSSVRLGDGFGVSISPDSRQVLGIAHPAHDELLLLPTRSGEFKGLGKSGLSYQSACWFPDGRRVLIVGNSPNQGPRLFVQEVVDNALVDKPRPISPEGETRIIGQQVSPDGKWVSSADQNGKVRLYPVDGGQPKLLSALAPGVIPARWSSDGRSLYVWTPGQEALLLNRIDVDSQRIQRVAALQMSDPAALTNLGPVVVTPDGKFCVYGYERRGGGLYLVKGLQ